MPAETGSNRGGPIVARNGRRAVLLAALILSGCAAGAGRPAAEAPPLPKPQLAGIQYLYGSAEAAALSRASWNALVDHVALHLKDRQGVVLQEGATLAAPAFLPCGARPPAAVFDVDETVLLNLGFESDALARPGGERFDQARWERWEKGGAAKVVPTPGAKEALDRLRALGVTVIFNTNRSAANAAETERALDGAGLGPAVHGRTLYLMGDDATGSHKDGRRARIAGTYCVVAMGGDQLGDFSDLFNAPAGVAARRARAALPGIAPLWGRGWFLFPNPVYGTALRGGMDDLFPADTQWHDPLDTPAKELR